MATKKDDNKDWFYSNKYVLGNSKIFGLSQSYFVQFFVAIPFTIFIGIAAIFLTENPLIANGLSGLIIITVYIVLRVKVKKYGEKPNEIRAYKKQQKEIIIDEARIFHDQ